MCILLTTLEVSPCCDSVCRETLNSSDATPGWDESYIYGYSNATQLKNQLILVDTYEEFSQMIQSDWKNQSAMPYYKYSDVVPFTRIRGGVWMGDGASKPTILGKIGDSSAILAVQNLYNNMAGGVGISASYFAFAVTRIPDLIDFLPLTFVIYYGLIMAW
jgi:ATP-binding cassette subfamily A (ABC1) protein 3